MTKWLITTLLLFLAGCDRSGQQPNTPPRSQPQETTPQPAYTEPTEAERRLGYYEYCRGVAYPEYWQNTPSPGHYRGEYGGVMDTSLNGWHFHTEMTRPDTVLLRYLFLNETLLYPPSAQRIRITATRPGGRRHNLNLRGDTLAYLTPRIYSPFGSLDFVLGSRVFLHTFHPRLPLAVFGVRYAAMGTEHSAFWYLFLHLETGKWVSVFLPGWDVGDVHFLPGDTLCWAGTQLVQLPQLQVQPEPLELQRARRHRPTDTTLNVACRTHRVDDSHIAVVTGYGRPDGLYARPSPNPNFFVLSSTGQVVEKTHFEGITCYFLAACLDNVAPAPQSLLGLDHPPTETVGPNSELLWISAATDYRVRRIRLATLPRDDNAPLPPGQQRVMLYSGVQIGGGDIIPNLPIIITTATGQPLRVGRVE